MMQNAISQLLPSVVAWVPFFEPMNFFLDWGPLLAIPLAICIAITYKAIRVRHAESYWRGVATMSIQILFFMILMKVVLFVMVEFLLPLLPVG